MEILLVCLAELDCDPALLAEAVCSREITRRQKWDVHCSGDAQSLRCGEAFCEKMKTQLFVDYRWDDPHTAARPEPPRLPKAQYLSDWFQQEDQTVFNDRINKRFFDSTRNRMVLCGRKLMTMLGKPDAAAYQFTYTIQGSETVDVLLRQDLQAAVQRLSEQQEKLRIRMKVMEKLRPEVPELAQRIVATVSNALQPLSGAFDVAPLLQQLSAAVASDLQEVVKKLEELYQQGLARARESVEETMKRCNDEYLKKMEELNAKIQGLEKQQKEAIALIESLKKALSSIPNQQLNTDSVSKRLESLEAANKLYESKIAILYDGLPQAKKKRPPLAFKLEEDFRFTVVNRKKYTVEDVSMAFCLVEKETACTYLPAKSYSPGTVSGLLEVPGNMQGFVRIVLKQANTEVSNDVKLTLAEELDHSIRMSFSPQ